MSINIYSPRPSKVLFIDEKYLKDTTEIDQNTDPRLIRTTIQYTQDRFILPLLGNNLFESWKQQIQSGITLQNNPSYYMNPNELTLLTNWVQPCLAAAVMIDLVKKITFQYKNKGATASHSEFSNTISDAQLNWLSENYRETAAFYAQRATQYLIANNDIFPTYLNPQLNTSGTGADLFYPNNTKYNSGIFIPGLNTNSPVIGMGQGGGIGWGLSVQQRAQLFGFDSIE